MTEHHSSRPMQDTCGLVAVVTGAAGGMGQALCSRLVHHGWRVVAVDHSEQRLPRLAKELGAPLVPACIDLTSGRLVEVVEQALDTLQGVRLAGLVNLAGASIGAPLEALTDDDWERSFAVNVTPAMRLARRLVSRMDSAKGASIVNVGSPVGIVGARKPSYAASKAALHGLTMALARRLGQHRIRVNLLLPGPTITYMTGDWPEERRRQIAEGSFLKRLCRPEEIASAIHFLLGEDASYITGSVVDMTAGSMWGH